MYLYPYKAGSQSAKDLSQALGAKRIRREKSKFKGNANKVVINWGNSSLPAEVMKCRVINSPEAVAICANKLSFFRHLSQTDASIPDFTEDKATVREWIDSGDIVFARTKLTGNSGEGIIELPDVENPQREIPNALLYVKYIPKKQEYRVHIFQGRVLSVQRKALRNDFNREQANWRIRNHDGGFIFARNEDHVPHETVEAEALKAFNLIEGLDFGSVDVVFNEKRKASYVLEINTASGLSGTTLEEYTEAFRQLK